MSLPIDTQTANRPTSATHWRSVIALLVAGLVALGVLLTAVDSLGSGARRFAAEPAVERTTPELPREWRWERKAITFDHMFRKTDSDR